MKRLQHLLLLILALLPLALAEAKKVKPAPAQPDNRAILAAFESYDIDLIKQLQSDGYTIPRYKIEGQLTLVEWLAFEWIKFSLKTKEAEKESLDEAFRIHEYANKAQGLLEYLLSMGFPVEESDSKNGNFLHHLAKKPGELTSFHINMAKYFIKKGMQVDRLTEEGTPLFVLLNKSEHEQYRWKGSQHSLKNLLLENGANPQYAVLAHLLWPPTENIFTQTCSEGSQIKDYMKMCKEREPFSFYYPGGRLKKQCLFNHFLLLQYKSSFYIMEKYLLFIMDNGFYPQGLLETKNPCSPLKYYLSINSGFFCEPHERVSRVILNKGENENLSHILFTLVKDNNYGSSLDPKITKFLLERKAALSVSESYAGNRITNTAQLLLMTDADFLDLSYDYISRKVATKMEKHFVFDEKNLTQSDLEHLDEWITKYVENARLFIKYGAGDILTKEAFTKAGIPERVYSRILNWK